MKSRFVSLVIIFVAIPFLVLSILWWYWGNQPVCFSGAESNRCQETLFVIKKGDGIEKIAAALKTKEIIKSPLVFKIQAVRNNLAKKIQAGEFYLSGEKKPLEIAQSLTRGSFDKKVTVLEGWRSEEIGESLLLQGIDINLESWRQEVQKGRLEGYLFPDTYMMPQSISAVKLIDIFLKNFEKKFTPDLEKEALLKGMDKNQVLILASLVEREAHHEKDRPIVAGILSKRLRNNWPLQVDASVQYALASKNCPLSKANCQWWPQSLSEKDLKTQSSYNTYLYRGLPPAPICNPSLSSIKAVIFSQESPYWFYLSDKQGEIHYAVSDRQQAENIRKYLR